MCDRKVYHQFTVLYFPETDTWQIAEDLDDGIFDCETYSQLDSSQWTADDEVNDKKAVSFLNKMFKKQRGA